MTTANHDENILVVFAVEEYARQKCMILYHGSNQNFKAVGLSEASIQQRLGNKSFFNFPNIYVFTKPCIHAMGRKRRIYC